MIRILKINEEVLCKLVVLLSAQYEDVVKMARNGNVIDILNMPLIQRSSVLGLIMKLSKLEKDIDSINCINDLVEKVNE